MKVKMRREKGRNAVRIEWIEWIRPPHVVLQNKETEVE